MTRIYNKFKITIPSQISVNRFNHDHEVCLNKRKNQSPELTAEKLKK